jgi:glyoxylase-like metal-dependent hydrolase (beta-lactamase superfamily II)
MRAFLTLCLLLLCPLIAAGQPLPQPRSPAADGDIVLTPQRISEHAYVFQGEAGPASAANRGFMSNSGFAVTTDGVVVFDALGTPALGAAMVKAIARVTREPIRRVIVSHYHADHFYGLQPLKAAGAEIWAHTKARDYLASPIAQDRLEQRRTELFPWVDEKTRLVPADLWLDGDTDFVFGGLHFSIIFVGGGHSPEDVMLAVKEDDVLFAGDMLFAGRIPFVGNADSKVWLLALDKMLALKPRIVVPGHGAISRDPERDASLTRDYLRYLRETMGRAARDMEDFSAAYDQVDWSRFSGYPAFREANRGNAYNTYLLMEKEALQGK